MIRKRATFSGLIFALLALITWFVVPVMPVRTLSPSSDRHRCFVEMIRGGRWALTAGLEPDAKGNIERVAPIRLYDLIQGSESFDVIESGDLMGGWMGDGIAHVRTLLSPDGVLLAISTSRRLLLWDLHAKRLLATLPWVVYVEERWSGWPLAMQFSYDSQRLYYCAAPSRADGFIDPNYRMRVWNLADGQEVEVGEEGTRAPFAISPDGRHLATASGRSYACVYDLATGEIIERVQMPEPGGVLSLAWSADGDRLAIAAFPKAAPLLPRDPEYGKTPVVIWDIDGRTVNWTVDPIFSRQVQQMQFSPDGRFIAIQSGTTSMWDASLTPPVQIGVISAWPQLAFSADGQYSITCEPESSGKPRLWRLGTPVKQAPVLVEDYQDVEFSTTADRVMVRSMLPETRSLICNFWEPTTGKKLSTFSDINWGGFAPDGLSFYARHQPTVYGWGELSWTSISVFDVSPGPPWIWLIPLWTTEAGVVALVAMRMRRNGPRPTVISDSGNSPS